MEYKKIYETKYGKHTTFEKFGVRFYASKDEVEEHEEEFKKIITEITEALKDSENFGEISFCDVSAGFIQINLINKTTPGYVYVIGELPHDWDNFSVDEVIQETLEMWREMDNEKSVRNFKKFIEDGNKYGWD